MRGKWDEIPIFHSSIFPFFPEVEDLPYSSLCKIQLTALTDRKKGNLAAHSPSPPLWLFWMLEGGMDGTVHMHSAQMAHMSMDTGECLAGQT